MARTFGEKSTTDEVLAGVDLAGRSVLITGVSAGLGVETARALAAHGASVVGTARDLEKAGQATQAVREAASAGGGSLELIELDLASLASVRKAADALVGQGRAFDIVIANAGVMAPPLGKTVDGFETQFGTNHLGHFLFVNRIAGLIRPGGRLVVLASAGHRFSDVNLEDPGFERTEYDRFPAYGRSKTANVLFAVEFDRRHRDRGIRAAAVHPGGIRTELGRHMDGDVMARFMELAKSIAAPGESLSTLKSIPEGAATTTWAAVVADADEIGGRYCEDCHVAEVKDGPGRSGVRSYALDPERAKALWARSEEMVGERF
ncbi:SDR family NAD(P)-dependent oxidoreductase [Sphingobium sp. Sx8-8]|uniref:SDR family NAD(P)-dependent oxidoreductase n=1 Tax=Sphingobium sp. Sx8-8 TaxID=2933617 RepID=UPI001F59414A|nr:SDR family NAD(P)-dependent oxidoreductase [Sphingobium sp. Sx8-8]